MDSLTYLLKRCDNLHSWISKWNGYPLLPLNSYRFCKWNKVSYSEENLCKSVYSWFYRFCIVVNFRNLPKRSADCACQFLLSLISVTKDFCNFLFIAFITLLIFIWWFTCKKVGVSSSKFGKIMHKRGLKIRGWFT